MTPRNVSFFVGKTAGLEDYRPLRSLPAVKSDTGANGCASLTEEPPTLGGGRGEGPDRPLGFGHFQAGKILLFSVLSRRNRTVLECGNLSHLSHHRPLFQNITANLGETSLFTTLNVRTGPCSQPASIRPLPSPRPGPRPVLTRRLFLQPGVPLSARCLEDKPIPASPRWPAACADWPCVPRPPWRPLSSVRFPVPVSIGPL